MTLLDKDGVRLTVDGAVATVTLANPAKRNAQSPAMWRALAEAGSLLPGNVRVVVLRGEGKSFSAGLDRQAFTPEGFDGEPSFLDLARGSDERAGRDHRRVPGSVHLVAAQRPGVHRRRAGPCHRRGLPARPRLRPAGVRATTCSSPCARPASGLVPDLTGTHPLVGLVGYARALEICATGRFVHAEEAERIGLANLVVPADELDGAVPTWPPRCSPRRATPSSRPRRCWPVPRAVRTRSSAPPSAPPRPAACATSRASATSGRPSAARPDRRRSGRPPGRTVVSRFRRPVTSTATVDRRRPCCGRHGAPPHARTATSSARWPGAVASWISTCPLPLSPQPVRPASPPSDRRRSRATPATAPCDGGDPAAGARPASHRVRVARHRRRRERGLPGSGPAGDAVVRGRAIRRPLPAAR